MAETLPPTPPRALYRWVPVCPDHEPITACPVCPRADDSVGSVGAETLERDDLLARFRETWGKWIADLPATNEDLFAALFVDVRAALAGSAALSQKGEGLTFGVTCGCGVQPLHWTNDPAFHPPREGQTYG